MNRANFSMRFFSYFMHLNVSNFMDDKPPQNAPHLRLIENLSHFFDALNLMYFISLLKILYLNTNILFI